MLIDESGLFPQSLYVLYILYVTHFWGNSCQTTRTVCAVGSVTSYSETSVCVFYWCCVRVMQ
jgi:hypothetical protein